jgi:hypothetical protein
MHISVRVRIGTQVCTATLPDQAAAQAFAALLPLTLDMTELNGNEKFAELPKKLPVSASNPGRIEAGDLMLYGAGTLVIFYRSFATPYSYTRLGRIEPADTLADALGRGDVSVTFELE